MLPAVFPTREAEDRLLGILPLYHIYGTRTVSHSSKRVRLTKMLFLGATKLMMLPLNLGIPMYLMTRFEPVQFCQNIEKYKITHSLIVPPVMVLLARLPSMFPVVARVPTPRC